MAPEDGQTDKLSIVRRALGVIGAVGILVVGGFLFVALFAGIAMGSDAGPSNANIRMFFGYLNIFGTPTLTLAAATLVIRNTWGDIFAFWFFAAALALTISAFVYLFTV